MSLRVFHLVFVLLVMVAVDLFGVWAIRHFSLDGDWTLLVVGVLAFICGLGLAVYAFWFVRKLDRLHIE